MVGGMGKQRATVKAHDAGYLVGTPSRFDHAVVRWYRRYWKRRGHRVEIVQDRLLGTDELDTVRDRWIELAVKYGRQGFTAVADLDAAGPGNGWAVAVNLEPQGHGYVIREVRVFPAMPGDNEVDAFTGEPFGAAPMPCNACGQLMPQGPTPPGGITDKVYRSATPMHYRAEALSLLGPEDRAHLGGDQAAAMRVRMRTKRVTRITPHLLAEIALAVNDAHDRGSVHPNQDAGASFGKSAAWIRNRLVGATSLGIIEKAGQGHRGPRVFTAYGKQLLEERNRTT